MASQAFECCSLHYFNQWLNYDRGCESLSTENNGIYERNLINRYDIPGAL